jgi:hypothetical protein
VELVFPLFDSLYEEAKDALSKISSAGADSDGQLDKARSSP